jgi:hypothetical protein
MFEKVLFLGEKVLCRLKNLQTDIEIVGKMV